MAAQTIRIDLRPKRVIEERRITRFLNWSLTYGRYIIIVTELIVLLAFFSRFRLDQQLTDLHESINQKQSIILSLSAFEKDVRRIDERIKKIKELDSDHTLYLDALDLLDELVPRDVVLSKIDFQTTHVSFAGTSFTKTGFSRLMQNLKHSKMVRDVSVDSIAKPDNGIGELSFKVSFDLVPKTASL